MQSFKFVYKGRSFSVLPYKFPFTLEIDGEVLKFVDDSGNYEIIEEEK
jgi:hypothetical protein